MKKFRLSEQIDLDLMIDATLKRHPEFQEMYAQSGRTSEQLRNYCQERGYPSLGFEYDGKPIGGIMFDEHGPHLEVLPEFHGKWAVLWPAAIKWIFSIRDPIRIPVLANDKTINRFMARNNWPRVGETEGGFGKMIIYEMSSKALPRFCREPNR